MNLSQNLTLLKNIDASLNKKKIYFNALLSDGSQNALDRLDYSSSPKIFNWQNDKGVPVYIYQYIFQYDDSTEPNTSDMYHSGSFTNKIGKVNSAGTDIEEPCLSMTSNRHFTHTTNAKRTWFSNTGWYWRYDFSDAPMEIGVSGKFGQYIDGDLSNGNYDNDPIGHLQGYYYAS